MLSFAPRYTAPFAALAAWLALAGGTSAQDYMGMVEQYGWNVQSTLQTEIMNNAGRTAMRQATGQRNTGGAAATPNWPAGISDADATSRVFSVDELDTMLRADPDRLRRMIDGRVISVQGRVERGLRADSSFHLAGGPNASYRVWANWRRGVNLPDAGATVALRGRVEMERRSQLSMRDGEFITAQARPAENVVAADPSPQATEGDLRFARSSAVTRQANEVLVRVLEPSLKPGNSAAELRAVLDGGTLQAAFTQILQAQGFSPDNLGDVIAAHLVVLWQVAHNAQNHDEPQGYQAVRQAIRSSLVDAGWVAQLSDSQKQTYAEIIGTGSMLVVARYLHAIEGNNRSELELAAQDARELVRANSGFDLMAYDLRANGFVQN